MVVFAVMIAFTIAIINHFRISEQAIRVNQFQVEKIEAMIEYALHTIDKAYYYFDEEVTEKMRTNTMRLMELYGTNASIDTWDMTNLKEELDMDIYIINSANVIIHSTKQSDIGMDFNACCGKLAKILDERRESGSFYHDGMDIAQATGAVTKFSYMATPDKEYIIELSYSLQDGAIFNDFNFLSAIEELEASYPSINKINILNLGGLALGDSGEESKLTPERREAFEKTLNSREVTEVRTKSKGETVTYRYVPYDSGYDFGSTQNKVIEIAYNEKELEAVLKNHKKVFAFQLAFILLITIIIALIISKWVARPMYMAFHDNLTGLRNRAAFEDDLHKVLHESDGQTGLIMLDLDHFKSVNDQFGHAEGDQLLKSMAKTIQLAIHPAIKTYRLGGDEFAIVLKDTNEEEAVQTAEQIIEALDRDIREKYKERDIDLTASIGIALSEEDTVDGIELYKEADTALYESKEKGKNQYQVFI